jgi:hypothetical protein
MIFNFLQPSPKHCHVKQRKKLNSYFWFHRPSNQKCSYLWIDGMWKSITIKITITNSRHQVSVAANYCMLVPNICGSSVWTLFLFTFLGPRSLKWILDFWKFVHSCHKTFLRTCHLCFLLKETDCLCYFQPVCKILCRSVYCNLYVQMSRTWQECSSINHFFPYCQLIVKKDCCLKHTVILGNHPLSWQQETIMLTDL